MVTLPPYLISFLSESPLFYVTHLMQFLTHTSLCWISGVLVDYFQYYTCQYLFPSLPVKPVLPEWVPLVVYHMPYASLVSTPALCPIFQGRDGHLVNWGSTTSSKLRINIPPICQVTSSPLILCSSPSPHFHLSILTLPLSNIRSFRAWFHFFL